MTVDHWKGAVPVAAAKAVAGDAGAGGVGAADAGVSQGTVAPPAGNAAVVWDAGAVAVSLQGAATLPAAAECQFLPVSACVGAYFSALAHRIAWSAQHYPKPWLRDSFVLQPWKEWHLLPSAPPRAWGVPFFFFFWVAVKSHTVQCLANCY